jgi:hypothetical protein
MHNMVKYLVNHDQVYNQVRSQVRSQVYNQVYNQVHYQVLNPVETQLRNSTDASNHL